MSVEQARITEVAELLAYAAACDPRLNTVDAEQARARVTAWVSLLDGVPADYAAEHIGRHYRRDGQWPVTAGGIRQAWLRDRARAEQPALVAHAGTPVTELPEAVRAAADAARAEIRRNRAEMGWT